MVKFRETVLALVQLAKTIIPRVPDKLRVYAIGDVHGRVDLLSALLARVDTDLIDFPVARSVEVFLGDYIDRGSHPRQVLDLLIERRKRRTMVCLKGNHEAHAIRALSDPLLVPRWQEFGGISTMLSYGATPPETNDPAELAAAVEELRHALPESHSRFLDSLALSFTCGDFFLVHAGVRPGVSLALQSQRDLLWIREDFLSYQGSFDKIIVHGHTPVREPDIRANRINIDTRAYATGRLTCLVLEGDQMRFL
ncbi:MAG: metallophosphoesterase family protein [Bryobacteraceae bacterium]